MQPAYDMLETVHNAGTNQVLEGASDRHAQVKRLGGFGHVVSFRLLPK